MSETAEKTYAQQVDEFADEYADTYEMNGESEDGRDACYTPNEVEHTLIRDAIAGLLADEDFVTLVGKQYLERQECRKAEGRCMGCGAPAGTHWGIRPDCTDMETAVATSNGCGCERACAVEIGYTIQGECSKGLNRIPSL